MTKLTEESLGVFWLFEDGHEEVLGVLAYGFFTNMEQHVPVFPHNLWPEDIQIKTYVYKNEAWKIIEWTIQFNRWPTTKQAEWEELIGETLYTFTTHGAIIAWCGLEGYFVTPPSLFSATEMAGGVYAILIPGNELICSAQLQKPFQAVGNEDLFRAELIVKQFSGKALGET